MANLYRVQGTKVVNSATGKVVTTEPTNREALETARFLSYAAKNIETVSEGGR